MQRKVAQSAPSLRKNKRGGDGLCSSLPTAIFVVLGVLLLAMLGFLYEFAHEHDAAPAGAATIRRAAQQAMDQPSIKVPNVAANVAKSANQNDHEALIDTTPVLPIFVEMPNGQQAMEDTLNGKPTMAGIITIMQSFLNEFHTANVKLHANRPTLKWSDVTDTFFSLTSKYLLPFDKAYHGKSIFPVREDDSIFMSLAAYREHLLKDTLVWMFDNAKHPDKLFVGAVVQNCFGLVREDGSIDTSGNPCKTGMEVVGKDANGRDQTKVSDRPPDVNGIYDFCQLANYKKYCENGQVRALYVHETESLGPAMARYYASKLWGGETYFCQTDSHLQFAKDWDAKYIAEVKATRNFPKSVLSSYPPGFSKGGAAEESNGSRLCSCETKAQDPNPIIRINIGHGYHGNEPRPTQIPFIAAGFFFARAEFLIDVPFDPLIPWCFMGEEIAMSMRAWTHGWDIYAPRKNLIAHQYRPGRMGLPKFWETTNRLYVFVGKWIVVSSLRSVIALDYY